ncbi:MAG: phosphoribosylformylglycinamidine cyclo-ligase [Euryarchaeota archaeon]|nr:phosphoribosylformylglycinamidine cyclo-ligase [Euryarchaeota archaeon]
MTYAKAGVDIDKESLAIRALAEQLKATLALRRGRAGESLLGVGHFAALVKLDERRALALSADGVGTKILVARAMEKYDTIGIDLVAMNANDIICVGAEPLVLLDYLAVEDPDPGITAEIAKGLAKGAELAGISIPGGELATLPEMVRGFDLAGLIIGMVEMERIVTGEKVAPGDVVVGLESSGIHSNGLTLARKVILEHYGIDDEIFPGRKAGEELLEPTKIYVREVLRCLEEVDVHGLANITGGGLANLTRITRHGYYLDALPEPPRIFKLVQELGRVPEQEMYRTFNMGVGFCIVVSEEQGERVVEICRRFGTRARVIGRVVEGENVVRIAGKSFTLRY